MGNANLGVNEQSAADQAAAKKAEEKKLADQKEEARRKKEQEEILSLERQVRAQLLHQLPDIQGELKRRVDEKEIAAAWDKQKSGPALSTESPDLVEDGEYSFKGVNIKVENGKATVVGGEKRNLENEIVGLMKATNGGPGSNLYIDYPLYESGPNQGKPNVREEELEEILRLCKKYHLNPVFGNDPDPKKQADSNIAKYYADNKRYRAKANKYLMPGEPTGIISWKNLSEVEQQARKADILKLKMEAIQDAAQHRKEEKNTPEYKKAEEQISYQRHTKNLNTDKLADTPEKQQKIKDEINNLATTPEKLEKIKQNYQKINDELAKLQKADNYLKDQTTKLSEQFKNSSKDIKDPAVASLAKAILGNQKEREGLMDIIIKKEEDLKKLKELNDKELDTVTKELEKDKNVKDYLDKRKSLEDQEKKMQIEEEKTSKLSPGDQENIRTSEEYKGMQEFYKEEKNALAQMKEKLDPGKKAEVDAYEAASQNLKDASKTLDQLREDIHGIEAKEETVVNGERQPAVAAKPSLEENMNSLHEQMKEVAEPQNRPAPH